MNVVTQANWLKGLNAATGKTTTAPGTVIRNSNILYTKRGSLLACDGSKIISTSFNWVANDGVNQTNESVNEMLAGVISGPGNSILAPIAIAARFPPPGGALAYSLLEFYDLSTNPATHYFIGSGNLQAPAVQIQTRHLVQAFNAGNQIVVCSGNNIAFESPTVVDLGPTPKTGVRLNIFPNGPVAAAHGIYHQGFVWLFNTAERKFGIDGPSVLRMCGQDASGNLDLTNWPLANAYNFDPDDGTQGQGLIAFTTAEAGISPTATLVLFKDFSTFQFTGLLNSAGGFSVSRAQTDMGCIAPRTIQFAPGIGIIRFTHFGVAVFDGVKDTLISEEIRPYIFGGEPDIQQIDMSRTNLYSACISVDPPMYILGAYLPGIAGISRLFCYDLVLKVWTVIDLPQSGLSTSAGALTTPMLFVRLATLKMPNQVPMTLCSDFDPANDGAGPGAAVYGDQGVRRWLGGDPTWSSINAPIPVTWSVTTPEVFGKNPGSRIYFRRTSLRAKAGSPVASITAAFNYGGTGQLQNVTKVPQFVSATSIYGTAKYGSGVYGGGDLDIITPFDIGVTAFSAHVKYTGSGPIELLANDWVVDPQPEGAFARVS